MAKENQRVALSKQLLKNAVLVLLKKKRIEEISIRELCDEAEINRTTFYRHYESPTDVLLEIELDFVNTFYEVHTLSNDLKILQRYIADMCKHLYENRDIVKLFMQNNTDSDFTKIFEKLSSEFLSTRTPLYKGKTIDENTLRLINTLFSHGVYAAVRQWLMEDIQKSPEEIAELIYSCFIRDFCFQR